MSQSEDVVHPDMNTIVPGVSFGQLRKSHYQLLTGMYAQMTEGWKAAVNSPLYDNT
jgi:hypothetical protein